MDANAISIAARNLRTYLSDRLDISEDNLLIGHPTIAATTADANPGDQFINLFFFRVEHGGYPADAKSTDPFYIRIYCLVTAFGNNETGDDGTITISAGENDLRLMGGVMAHLHANPVLVIEDLEANTVAHLQVILSPMDINDINNIWSTQVDTPYRLSVIYELALAPIPLATMRDTSKRVARIGVEARSGTVQNPLPGQGLGIEAQTRYAVKMRIQTAQEARAPHLILFNPAQEPVYTLVYAADDVPSEIPLLALGKAGDSVSLVWEQWHAQQGWHDITPSPAPRISLIKDRFDPIDFDPTQAQNVALPATAPGQLMLYAIRTVTKPGGKVVTIRSNPLLISIYKESAS
ncbi:MAG: Pvc16 family protein [Desulfobacteraceae bacterium]|jgi:hypothetical protein